MLEIGNGNVVGLWWANHRLKKVQTDMSVMAFQAALEGGWRTGSKMVTSAGHRCGRGLAIWMPQGA